MERENMTNLISEINKLLEDKDNIEITKKTFTRLKKQFPMDVRGNEDFSYFLSALTDEIKLRRIFTRFINTLKFLDLFNIPEEALKDLHFLLEVEGIALNKDYGEVHEERKKDNNFQELTKHTLGVHQKIKQDEDKLNMILEEIADQFNMSVGDVKKCLNIEYNVQYKDKIKDMELKKIESDIERQQKIIEYLM
jgi:hypothetical protein